MSAPMRELFNTRLNFSCEVVLAEAIRALAVKKHITMSDVIREALEVYIKKQEGK